MILSLDIVMVIAIARTVPITIDNALPDAITVVIVYP